MSKSVVWSFRFSGGAYVSDCLGVFATTERYKADRPVATHERRYLRVHSWSVQKDVEHDTIHIKLHSWRERVRNQTKTLGIQAGLMRREVSVGEGRGMLTEVVAPSTRNLFPPYQFQN